MPGRKLVGWVALVGGGLLIFAGYIWGRGGYYESQAPILLLLVLGGVAALGLGVLLLRKPKQDAGPVRWRPPQDGDGS